MARVDTQNLGLKPHYTFDQLIVGAHNQMAAAASLQVAKQLGEAYNPLYLYGPTGVGKTHMIQSIANALLVKNPDLKVKYLSAERFVNEVITAISEDNLMALRQQYGQLDLFLLDDMQFMLDSKSSQEEFLHLFNNLHQNNRQVIIASDRSPNQLTVLDKAIRSRLEWGLVAEVKLPDVTTRVEILKLKQRNYGLSLTDDAIRYTSEMLSSNVREMEGFLKRLHAYVTLSHQQISMDLVKRVVSEILPQGATPAVAEAPVSMGTSSPILASLMEVAPLVSTPPAPVVPAPAPVASPPPPPPPPPAPPAPPVVEKPKEKPPAEVMPPPVYTNGHGTANVHPATSSLEETFSRLPEIPAAPLKEPVGIQPISRLPEPPPLPSTPPPPPPAPPTPPVQKRVFDIPFIDPAEGIPPQPPAPPSGKEVKRAPFMPQMMDDPVPAETAPAAAPAPIELIDDSEPLPAGHKEIFAVFFYPQDCDDKLKTVVSRFQEVVRKHKLKFRLRRVADHAYNHKNKVNYTTFVDVCKQNKVPVAIVIGPPPGGLVAEHEFYDLLSVTLDVQGVSLQMVSWSEIDKDYRYLNLALDIALVRAR